MLGLQMAGYMISHPPVQWNHRRLYLPFLIEPEEIFRHLKDMSLQKVRVRTQPLRVLLLDRKTTGAGSDYNIVTVCHVFLPDRQVISHVLPRILRKTFGDLGETTAPVSRNNHLNPAGLQDLQHGHPLLRPMVIGIAAVEIDDLMRRF